MEPATKSEDIERIEIDEDAPVRICVDCERCAPADVSEYTLFSSKYGWRLTKSTSPSGDLVLELHCAECFAKHRASSTSDPG